MFVVPPHYSLTPVSACLNPTHFSGTSANILQKLFLICYPSTFHPKAVDLPQPGSHLVRFILYTIFSEVMDCNAQACVVALLFNSWVVLGKNRVYSLSFGFFIFKFNIIMLTLWGCIKGSDQFLRHSKYKLL